MGDTRTELKANLAPTIVMVLFFVVPLAIGGVALIQKAPGAGITMLVCAAVLTWLAVRLGARRLVIDETGLTAKGVFSTSALTWAELDHYTFWSMDQSAAYGVAGAQGGVVGVIVVAALAAAMAGKRGKATANRRFQQGRLTVFGQDGKKISIDLRYRKPALALDHAFDRLHAQLRKGSASGSGRDYAPFTLGDVDLHHATKGSIGLPDIEKVSAPGASLVVKKRDKRLAWARVPMRRIHNSMLLLEDLAERGLVVDTQAGMFVPPTILDKLRAATARQAGLPKARVVER